METNHTKGEWLFSKGYTPHFQCEVYSQETGQPIAVTYSDEGEHNARLIASAPDLLSECLRTQDEIASALRDGTSHFNEDMLRRWYRGVSAAIQKATQP